MQIKTVRSQIGTAEFPLFHASHFAEGFHIATHRSSGKNQKWKKAVILTNEAKFIPIPREFAAQVLRAWRKA